VAPCGVGDGRQIEITAGVDPRRCALNQRTRGPFSPSPTEFQSRLLPYQLEEPTLRSRAIRDFHRLPVKRTRLRRFAAFITSLARERQFDVVCPAGDPSLEGPPPHKDVGLGQGGCNGKVDGRSGVFVARSVREC
jgi:hypothetical protein